MPFSGTGVCERGGLSTISGEPLISTSYAPQRMTLADCQAPWHERRAGHGMQVERDNLYSAFYKLTDSRSQITSYVFDVGAQAASHGP